VQHWLADVPEEAKDSHSPVACPACTRTHFIHNSTGRLLGDRGSWRPHSFGAERCVTGFYVGTSLDATNHSRKILLETYEMLPAE